MFLNWKTSNNYTVSTVYSALQKSIRSGDRGGCSYWSKELDKWPNALRKRLLQNALEDSADISFCMSLFRALPPSRKPTYDELTPYVGALCELPKTHISAWLNRVAADELWKSNLGSPEGNELEQATHALKLHSEGRVAELSDIFGDEAVALYKYVNRDPLVFHCLILSKRPEIKSKESFVLQSLPDAPPQPIKDYYLDKHTREGKKKGRGYSHFINNMILNKPIYEIDSEPYRARATKLYTTFRENGKECRVAHVLKFIRDGKRGENVMKKDEKEESPSEDFAVPLVPESPVPPPYDHELFGTNEGTQGLGFKNATFIASARTCLVDLIGDKKIKSSDRIFVKIGESRIDNDFAVRACEMRKSLGLTSMVTASLDVIPSLDYGQIAARGNARWGKNVNGKVERAKNRGGGGFVSALVVEEFDNSMRLTDSTSDVLEHPRFGIELLKVLLFRKFVGSRDTNGFNLMVRVSDNGCLEILSVDETLASSAHLLTYDKKGLGTSQKFRTLFMEKCAAAMDEFWDEVDDFVGRLRGEWKARFSKTILGQNGRMDKTHAILEEEWGSSDVGALCRSWLGVTRKRKRDA